MKRLVEKKVRAAVREVMDEDGLKDTIALSYNDLEYDMADIFMPLMKDANDDNEFDQLNAQCERHAKAHFSKIQAELKRAQMIINDVLAE